MVVRTNEIVRLSIRVSDWYVNTTDIWTLTHRDISPADNISRTMEMKDECSESDNSNMQLEFQFLLALAVI